MVEAAGVEPDHLRSTNWLMAHDFRRKVLIPRRFSPSIESPGVPYSPLESTPVVETFWRRDLIMKGSLRRASVETCQHFPRVETVTRQAEQFIAGS
jgi:hypothetical protein